MLALLPYGHSPLLPCPLSLVGASCALSHLETDVPVMEMTKADWKPPASGRITINHLTLARCHWPPIGARFIVITKPKASLGGTRAPVERSWAQTRPRWPTRSPL